MDNDGLIAQSHLNFHEKVRERAHQIWLSHPDRRDQDTALQDWLQAEQEVLNADSYGTAQNRGSIVGSARVPDRNEFEELGEA
jgi:hypothetical protein